MGFTYTSFLQQGLMLVLLLWVSQVQAITLETGKDEQARLPFWEVSNKDMSLRLVQRLPDQTRGFFMARGFKQEDAELIAQSCVFQTVFRNLSDQHIPSPLSYDLGQWQVRVGGRTHAMKMREAWESVWKQRGASPAAALAFNWALLPTQQIYKSGDYTWGMSIFDLKPGTIFDLRLTWEQHGKTQSAIIKKLQCAPDIHPDPEQFGK
ncbi:MAG: hypothetical protein BMS9Abin36_1254 [Gammaproteobacteria bacterium]|nr:MAG: hypothetical protein BMS9Abin36_1254 [Gammaproteobacteria bacterium]